MRYKDKIKCMNLIVFYKQFFIIVLFLYCVMRWSVIRAFIWREKKEIIVLPMEKEEKILVCEFLSLFLEDYKI